MKTKNKILLVSVLLALTSCFEKNKSDNQPTIVNNDQTAQVDPVPHPANPTTPTVSETPTVSAPVPVSGYQDGDIIFIQSQTSQSAALREATGSVWTHVGLLVKQNSKWYVYEAIGPVVSTPLADFIARSKNKTYEIYRFRHFDPITMRNAMLIAIQKYNKPYDIYFEFSDARTYCSELTYKVMLDVTGYGLGRVQKMRDMNLDGPYVKALIQKRLTEIGKELNLDEDIVTPISQMRDENVVFVEGR